MAGIVASIVQSKLILEDGEKQIELLMLPSFLSKKTAGSEYLEKKVEIEFLRVKPNRKQKTFGSIYCLNFWVLKCVPYVVVYTMDEYSDISLLPCVVPCGSTETRFMED